MFRTGDFAIIVRDSKGEVPKGELAFNKGERYSIQLQSNSEVKTKAEVFIEGQNLGSVEIPALSEFTIDHLPSGAPVTFDPDRPHGGRVSVRFIPEKIEYTQTFKDIPQSSGRYTPYSAQLMSRPSTQSLQPAHKKSRGMISVKSEEEVVISFLIGSAGPKPTAQVLKQPIEPAQVLKSASQKNQEWTDWISQ